MKNRRIAILAFLLGACLCLGIGYATLSETMHITGLGEVSLTDASTAFDADIYFTAAQAGDSKCTATITADDTADLTVDGLCGEGDSTYATYTITNFGDVNATVAATIASGETDLYDIEVEWVDGDNTLDAATDSVNDTAVIKVTVSLKYTPTVATSTTIKIDLVVTSVTPQP